MIGWLVVSLYDCEVGLRLLRWRAAAARPGDLGGGGRQRRVASGGAGRWIEMHLRLECVIESCFENLDATLRSVKRWNNIILWCFLETQEQTVRVWRISRLNMRLMENIDIPLVCHPCTTVIGKPLFGNDQIWQKRWTIEDQTWVHLETPPT